MIPIGLDLEPFLSAPPSAGEEFRGEMGADRDAVLLTFAGRLVPIKRVDVLLRAVATARGLGAPVRLAVVGDGDMRPELERLAGELGIADHVRFAGYRADMVAVAAASDLAVLSSDNEGTPVSLIEAAAAGTPAVATSVGGVPEVVTPKTGVLSSPGDAESLARAIATLASDPSRRTRLGQQARRHVATQFSVRRLLRDIASVYDELIRESTGILDKDPRQRFRGLLPSR